MYIWKIMCTKNDICDFWKNMIQSNIEEYTVYFNYY